MQPKNNSRTPPRAGIDIVRPVRPLATRTGPLSARPQAAPLPVPRVNPSPFPQPTPEPEEPLIPLRKQRQIPWRLILLVIVALVIVGAVTYGVIAMLTKKAPVKSASSPSSASTATQSRSTGSPASSANTSALLTYVNQDNYKNLILTDAQQKTLATVSLPTGKTTLIVLANNGHDVLVKASDTSSGPDKNSLYYLLTDKGTVTQLAASVATTLQSIAVSGVFLDTANDLLFVNCSGSTCYLNQLNLTNGSQSVVTSYSYTPNQLFASSIILLGVTPTNVAYLWISPNPDTLGSVEAMNITNKNVQSTVSLHSMNVNAPNLSPDYKYVVYMNASNNKTIELVNLQTGKTTDINPSIPAGTNYVWSPDSSKAAFVANAGPSASATTTLAYVTANTAKVTLLKNFGDPKTNNVIIDGWSDSTTLHYTYSQTATPNDFSKSSLQDFNVNIANQAITQDPTPNGYRLVSPASF